MGDEPTPEEIAQEAAMAAFEAALPAGLPKFAARMGDPHICPLVDGVKPHVGGPIAMSATRTYICGMLAARVGDMVTCVGPPDAIAMGSSGVFIEGMPAARAMDQTVHGGVIIMGAPTVFIGETGSGGGGGGPPAINNPLAFPSASGLGNYANWCGGDNAPARLKLTDMSPEQHTRVVQRLSAEGLMPPPAKHPTGTLEDYIPANEGEWNRWVDVLNEEIGIPPVADPVDQGCLLHDLRLGRVRTQKGTDLDAFDEDPDVAMAHAKLTGDFIDNLDNPNVPLKGRLFARGGAVLFVGMTINSGTPVGVGGALLGAGAAAKVLFSPAAIIGSEISVLLQSD